MLKQQATPTTPPAQLLTYSQRDFNSSSARNSHRLTFSIHLSSSTMLRVFGLLLCCWWCCHLGSRPDACSWILDARCLHVVL